MVKVKNAQSFVKPKAGQGAPLEGEVIVTVKGKPKRPTPKQAKAAKLYSENLRADVPKSSGAILREAGYSDEQSKKPSDVIESDTFQALLEAMLPDDKLTRIHTRLLEQRKIEHMVFPLDHQDPSDTAGSFPVDEQLREAEIESKRIIDNLSDEDIIDMLAEVSCKVKKIIHGETARHVYYWTHDAKAQHAALELAYRLKGHLTKDNGAGGINFNLFTGGQTFVTKDEQ